MKKLLLTCCLALCLCGCVSDAGLVAGSAASGAALTHTIAGAQRDLAAKKQALLLEQENIINQLELSNNEAEKTMLHAQIAALKKKLELVVTAEIGLSIAKGASKTDWSDPTSYVPWLLATVGALTAGVFSRKNSIAAKLLNAVKQGIEKFKAQSQPEVANKLYMDIKERKEINGV